MLYAWSEIECFPDSITVKTTNSDKPERLESTYGWKGNKLRDALNQLLVKIDPDLAKAQFEKKQNQCGR